VRVRVSVCCVICAALSLSFVLLRSVCLCNQATDFGALGDLGGLEESTPAQKFFDHLAMRQCLLFLYQTLSQHAEHLMATCCIVENYAAVCLHCYLLLLI